MRTLCQLWSTRDTARSRFSTQLETTCDPYRLYYAERLSARAEPRPAWLPAGELPSLLGLGVEAGAAQRVGHRAAAKTTATLPIPARPAATLPAAALPIATATLPIAARPAAALLVATRPTGGLLVRPRPVGSLLVRARPATALAVCRAAPITGATPILAVPAALATTSATRAASSARASGAAPAASALVRTALVDAVPAATAATPLGGRVVVQPQRQRDALAVDVHLAHLDPHDVAGLDDLAGVGDEPVGHRRDVHQPVLVHSHVDECAERGDVGDHTLQHHADGQVGQLLHPVGKGRRLEGGPGVTAGLLQLGEDVADRGQAECVVDEVGRSQGAQGGGVADQRGQFGAHRRQDPPHHRVGLGVHAGGVQRVVAAGYAQEAGALFERLGPEPGHLGQRLAV